MEGGGGEEGNDYLVNEGCFLRFLVVNFFSFVFFFFFFFFLVNFLFLIFFFFFFLKF